MGASWRLYLRWSWRDLRKRWVLVTAIAFVIGIGTGVFAGLGSTAQWRIATNDASYAALKMFDVRAALPPGVFAEEGALAAAVTGIPSAASVSAVNERLVVATQVDASTPSQTVLVPGRITGLTNTEVTDVHVEEGSGLDEARPVLEYKFAREYGLPASGSLTLSGGAVVAYGGVGYGPEDFMVITPDGALFAHSAYAIVYQPLAQAQAAAGLPGRVNDVVLTVSGDRDAVESQVATALAAYGAEVTVREEDPGYMALYGDVDSDTVFWNVFSVLVLLGATLAAFNLISRIVEAQRREIGVQMALGVPPRTIAVRPMLVGVQVALLGIVLGLGMGLVVAEAFKGQLDALLPMPTWLTPLQPEKYLQAAVLGLTLPLIATAYPVWRAVRIEPAATLRSAYGVGGTATGRSGTATGEDGRNRAGRLRLPGSSLQRMPIRNLLRARRRTTLTVLGIAATMTSLVAIVAMLDSYLGTIADGKDELLHSSPDRLAVSLQQFDAIGGPVVAGVATAPSVAVTEPHLQVAGTLSGNGTSFDVAPELFDMDPPGGEPLWLPTLEERTDGDLTAGIILARKAADDLGVAPGDTVALEHPRLEDGAFPTVISTVLVTGVHTGPLRPVAYLDDSQAAMFGLAGATNLLVVEPAPDATQDDVKRDVFGMPGVTTVQPIAQSAEIFERTMSSFTGILRILEGFVLLLVLLIAVNSASITIEERRREQATMFAFGVPVRRVLGILTRESVLMGLAGTVLGIVGGFGVLLWMVTTLLPDEQPDIGITVTITPASLVAILGAGTLVVALAPLLTSRRLRRMDVPSTLRVME